MRTEELLANYLPGRHRGPWSWDDEERDIAIRLCLCCGRAGHYQEQLEAHIEEHGLMGVCLVDGYVIDGHHRIIGAKHLGIDTIPLGPTLTNKRGDEHSDVWKVNAVVERLARSGYVSV